MVTDYSYSRKIKLTIAQIFSDAFLLSAFSLVFSISAHSLPLDILPLPNEVAFPKGGSSFEDNLLRPWYDALSDAGLAVGSQLSDDSKRLGITVWDAVNAREIGNTVIDLNLAHPDNDSYGIRSAISISDSSRLLVLVYAYHFPTKKDELLAYHGKIDSLVQLSIPVSEFSSVTLTTAALSGERFVVFKKGEFTKK